MYVREFERFVVGELLSKDVITNETISVPYRKYLVHTKEEKYIVRSSLALYKHKNGLRVQILMLED